MPVGVGIFFEKIPPTLQKYLKTENFIRCGSVKNMTCRLVEYLLPLSLLRENFTPTTFYEEKKIFKRKIVEWKQSGLETGMKNLKIPLPIQVYSPFIIFSSIVQPFQGFINPEQGAYCACPHF